MSDAADLYEQDLFAWTQEQAALLRAWPEALRPDALDVAHLAEEIEDLGSSERRAVESFVFQILVHLLKMKFHPNQGSRSHWRDEIDNFRAQLDRILVSSPSLRARRAELAPQEWQRTGLRFCRGLEDDGYPAEAALARLFTSNTEYFDLDAAVLEPDWFP